MNESSDSQKNNDLKEPRMLTFPSGFLWGAATSAHQVEGGTKNDWTEWEKKNAERLARQAKSKWAKWQVEKFPEMNDLENYISGRACDHCNRFEEDFDLAASGAHNAHRFSIEWSRIEPEEGKFDEKEIEHYRKVIEAVRAHGMEPFVTLWHFTNPIWIADKGGIVSSEFPEYFSRYAKKMVDAFGDLVKFWVTLNEPTTDLGKGYMQGSWPPRKMNPFLSLRAYKMLTKTHNEAYEAMHSSKKDIQVGFADVLVFLEPANEKSWLDRKTTDVAKYFANKKLLKLTKGHNDFITAQYYFHYVFKFPGLRKNKDESVTDMGWEIYPEGIYHVLKELKKYNLPIYITENGLADAHDEKRVEFIRDHLRWVHQAISEGVDVRGYFHWSLLDNFEWDKGFWPRFGLIEIDRETLDRKPRKSFYEYAKICRNNEVEMEV